MVAKFKALWAKVPKPVAQEAAHVAKVFVFTFAAVAAPLLPAVVASPSLSSVHALVAAGVAAGARAAWAVAREAVKAKFGSKPSA